MPFIFLCIKNFPRQETSFPKVTDGKFRPEKKAGSYTVSGCPNNCGEAYVRDIGVFARKGGWVFISGGNSGRRPRIGDILAEGLTGDEVVALAKKCLDYYKANAQGRERTARFIERIGFEEFKKAVLEVKKAQKKAGGKTLRPILQFCRFVLPAG